MDCELHGRSDAPGFPGECYKDICRRSRSLLAVLCESPYYYHDYYNNDYYYWGRRHDYDYYDHYGRVLDDYIDHDYCLDYYDVIDSCVHDNDHYDYDYDNHLGFDSRDLCRQGRNMRSVV
jgi:hypothetical protein